MLACKDFSHKGLVLPSLGTEHSEKDSEKELLLCVYNETIAIFNEDVGLARLLWDYTLLAQLVTTKTSQCHQLMKVTGDTLMNLIIWLQGNDRKSTSGTIATRNG